jgi:hypothetical protein
VIREEIVEDYGMGFLHHPWVNYLTYFGASDDLGCYIALPVPVPDCDDAYKEVVGYGNGRATWETPESVTWDGPPEMILRPGIKARFKSASIKMSPILQEFYLDLADVPKCTLDHLLQEFREFRDDWSHRKDCNQEIVSSKTRNIYKHLRRFMKDGGEEDLR